MLTRIARAVLFSSLLTATSNANAAVFRLNNATFSLTNPGSTGFAVGNYTISGEFKRDTTTTSAGSQTAWNITLNGPSGYSKNFVKGINGIADNSTTGIQAGTDLNRAYFGDPVSNTALAIDFAENFYDVYVDPQPGVNGVLVREKTNISQVILNGNGNSAFGANLTGQADFIPFTPSLMVLAPIPAIFLRLRARKLPQD